MGLFTRVVIVCAGEREREREKLLEEGKEKRRACGEWEMRHMMKIGLKNAFN
jgi:hypothetical protein